MVRSAKTKAIYGVSLFLFLLFGMLVALNLLGVFDPASKSIDATELSNYKYDVLIMRHELAPGGGDPKGFVLSNCSTQRNLNQEGMELASKTGGKLSSLTNIAPLIYSSKWCRCLETATQIALELSDSSSINYTVEGTRGLNSFYQPSIGFTKEECMGWLTTDILDRLKKVEPNDRVHQTLLVTHQVTVEALTGFKVESGGIVAYDSRTGDATRLTL